MGLLLEVLGDILVALFVPLWGRKDKPLRERRSVRRSRRRLERDARRRGK